MKAPICVFLVAILCLATSTAKDTPPKVQVYSRSPGMFGTPNTLICHVSGFQPPQIAIQLLKNDQEIPGAKQTDLAFEENWYYHLTKHVNFTPNKGDQYSCRVTHLGKTNPYNWEPDM